MQVEAIKHQNVRGTDEYYLKLKNENGELLLNVGVKTYQRVTELNKKPQPELPLGEKKNGK